MPIQFDIEGRRSVDNATGRYLEHHHHHYQDPFHHYTLHSEHGDLLLSASAAERRIDTRGDGTVGLIEADVYRVSIPQDDGSLKDIMDNRHPAVRQFLDFFEVWLFERRVVPQRVVIATKLGGQLPASPL